MTGWDLGGGGGNSFPFENLNDFVRGRVLDLTDRQQTDINTREPLFWDAEHKQPMMMNVVTLQTELRDPNNPSDDGKRTVMLKGSKKSEDMTTMSAVLDAVRETTGGTELKYGGELVIQYVGDRKAKGGGNFKAKCYKAWYTPPAMDLEQPESDRASAAQGVNNAMQQPPYSNYQNPPGAQGNYQQQQGPPPGQGGWTPPPGQQQQPPYQQQQQGPPPGQYQQQGPPPGYQQQGAPGNNPQGPAGGPPQGAGTQHQQQWPPQDAGPGPSWAQQEPPQDDPWASQQWSPGSNGAQQQGAPGNDPWSSAPGQQQQQRPQDTPPQQQQNGQAPAGNTITQSQVNSVVAANVDPAQVFGADYKSRIVPG